MKKKIFTILSLSAFSCFALAGCSLFQKPPTAEELIANAYPADMETMKAEMVLEFDGSAMLDKTTSIPMSMKMSADMESDKETTLMDGELELSIFGMQMKQEMKEYSEEEDGEITKYSWDSESDTWTYTIEDAEDEKESKELDPAVFKELTLEEIKKEDTVYTVKAKVDMDEISDMMNMDMEDMLSMTGEDIDYDDMKFAIVFTFDKETQHIKSFVIELNDTYKQDGAEITKFALSVKDVEFSNDEVSIPSKVIREAISADDYMLQLNEASALEESYTTEYDTETVTTPSSTDIILEQSYPADDFMTADAGDVDTVEEDELDNAGMSFDLVMCEAAYGIDYLYEDDLIELAEGKLRYGDDANFSILTFLNYYSLDEFLEYLNFWKYMIDEDKLATAYIVDMGIVDYDMATAAGADSDELTALLKKISE